jgi:hypothetical protein
VLLADAYGGYKRSGSGQSDDVGWMLVPPPRRSFIDAEKVAPEIAREAVDLIDGPFGVERQAKGFAVEHRLALRQAHSVPVLAKLRGRFWHEESHRCVLRSGMMA